jgi:hypothetical protein
VTFSWSLAAPSGIYLAMALAEKDSNVHVRKPTVFVHVAGDIDVAAVARLKIPAELSVLGPDDMVLRARRGLESKEADVRGYAAFLLHENAYVEGAVDALAGLVGDPEEYAALSAARALGLCGKRSAKVAVDALRRRAEKAEERLAKECRDAVAAIEAAPPLDAAEEKRIQEGLKAIRARVESRRKGR